MSYRRVSLQTCPLAAAVRTNVCGLQFNTQHVLGRKCLIVEFHYQSALWWQWREQIVWVTAHYTA